MRRVALALTAVLGATGVIVAPLAAPRTSAQTPIVSVVVDGTGNGHGRGMSQWGAYGWAVDQGKDWTWILDHYYGGTTAGDADTNGTIDVQLKALDGSTTVGVVSYAGAGKVRWAGNVATSMYATEVTENTFQVYGAPTVACPAVTSLTVPDGPIGQGSSDTAGVTQIQIFLNAFQAPSDLVVDGAFGNQTATRLAAWQTAQGLPVDRIWHPDDAAKARQLIADGAPTAAWAPIGGPVTGPIEFTTDNGPVNGARMTTGAATSALGACNRNGRVTHYRGSIRVDGASNRVMNRVRIEDYLRGVVPKEISASWADAGGGRGLQAVMAQAVAARSYALQPGRWANGICDSQSCQVYFGAASRASVTSPAVPVEDSRSDNAIAATTGRVRLWLPGSNGTAGTIVSTEFSGSNGPRTAGWPFPAVDDAPGDGTSLNRNHRWTRVLDANALAAKYGLGTLLSAAMVEGSGTDGIRYDGIWYNNVVLTGTGGSKTIPAWTFRNDNGLPSPGFTLRTESGAGGPMGANQRIELQVVGESVTAPDGSVEVIPPGVAAVALNVTAVTPSTGGYMTVWPCDTPRPEASNLNFAAGTVVANGVIAPVGANGEVCIFTNVSSHLLVDIAGWFDGSGSVVGATPRRLLDTRNGIGAPKVRLRAGGTITLPMVGARMQRANGTPDTIPANTTAVAINITAVAPSRAGYFTVWPCGSPRPEASNVNFAAGSVVANGVVASLGNGSLCIFSDQESDVLVDVLGWFVPVGGLDPYVGAVPRRLVDTRNAVGGPRGVVTPTTPRSVPVRRVSLTVNGAAQQVPADASAVALNITMTQTQAGGYATVWPCGTARPEASNVNFGAGTTVANGVIAPIGAGGSICVYTSANAHLIVDIAGWFTGGATASFEGNVPKRLVDTRNAVGPAPVG